MHRPRKWPVHPGVPRRARGLRDKASFAPRDGDGMLPCSRVIAARARSLDGIEGRFRRSKSEFARHQLVELACGARNWSPVAELVLKELHR